MTEPKDSLDTKIKKIAERSLKDPRCEFTWLMSWFSVENLSESFQELDGNKALGIDGKSKEDYALNLKENLELLVARMKTMSYRPQAVKEVLIPKSSGGSRPLGISSIEDKLVQNLMAKILGAIYEPTFLDYSYGFRPGKNCHQAVKAVTEALFCQRAPVIYEIDFRNFFGSIEHEKLIAILGLRIKDLTFLRYVSRLLKSDILAEGALIRNEIGTLQGSVVSPILANIFAHYALDIWFKEAVLPRMVGIATMVRYCDDAVFIFSTSNDAAKFVKALDGRVKRFGLELHPDKTKLIVWDKSQRRKGDKPGGFNFLGFTFYLGLSKLGHPIPKVKSDAARMRKKLKEIGGWIKGQRHKLTPEVLWKQLYSKLSGYAAYYCVSHNISNVSSFMYLCERLFFKWMNRRSQRRSFNWEEFSKFLANRNLKLPSCKVRFQLFSSAKRMVSS